MNLNIALDKLSNCEINYELVISMCRIKYGYYIWTLHGIVILLSFDNSYNRFEPSINGHHQTLNMRGRVLHCLAGIRMFYNIQIYCYSNYM